MPLKSDLTIGLSQSLDLLLQLQFPRLVVLGDFLLDGYTFGQARRVAPEAAAMVLEEIEPVQYRAGGAGNVALNLRALGGEVLCYGVRDSCWAGEELAKILEEAGVPTEGLLPGGNTPFKERFVCPPHQVLLRVDRDRVQELPESLVEKLEKAILESLEWADGVVIADYNKGGLPRSIIRKVFQRCRELELPVFVDTKRADLGLYRGAYLLTPNRHEAERVCPRHTHESSLLMAQYLRRSLDLQGCAITLAAEGLVLATASETYQYPSLAQHLVDPSGAGDTVLACLAAAAVSGLSWQEGALLATLCAAWVVEQGGTTPINLGELFLWLRRGRGLLPSEGKLLTWEQVTFLTQKLRQAEKTVVFTNGCFDLLHKGHLHLLRYARAQGDFLLVGLNSDESIQIIKGQNRPFVPLEQRAALLGELESVDGVIPFSEPTPLKLIEQIQPSVLVKSEEYRHLEVVGRSVVERSGGSIVFAPHVDGVSSTKMAERIFERFQGENPRLRWRWEEKRS